MLRRTIKAPIGDLEKGLQKQARVILYRRSAEKICIAATR
jgi:hypothetical protein